MIETTPEFPKKNNGEKRKTKTPLLDRLTTKDLRETESVQPNSIKKEIFEVPGVFEKKSKTPISDRLEKISKADSAKLEAEKVRFDLNNEFENKEEELNGLKEVQRELIDRIDSAEMEYKLTVQEDQTFFGRLKGLFSAEKSDLYSKKMRDDIELLRNELDSVNVYINELEK